ncbi:MAG: SdiA-regulated domain-containing protein [Saprospiraceae bacterium]
MELKHPNVISFGILIFILIFALSIAYFLYQEQPEGTVFQLEDDPYSFPYQLDHPQQQFYLPHELREVSGLAWSGDDRVVVIQDEEGLVFEYDLHEQEITRRVKFGKNLDYEGIAKVDKKIFVLESDGDIFEIDSLRGESVDSKKYETALSYQQDAEGLGYDPVDQCLLVALKEEKIESKETGEGDKRLIYSFDLNDHQLSEQPLYFIDELELGRLIYKKEKSFEFKPSAIAVDPQNKYIYVIASVGRLLVVMDRTGKLLYAERLSASQLPQPEGIAFAPDGRLFISSEGRSGQGRLMVYNPVQ